MELGMIRVSTDSELHSPRPTRREEVTEPALYMSRWAMLFYLSALAMLSDWLCFSAAPIATLVQRNLKLHDSHLVTCFLGTNVVACLLEPAFVRNYGLRAAVVWGAAVMSFGCFLRALAAELALLDDDFAEDLRDHRVPAMIAIMGTMFVGAAQPLFQCTPSLLAANWFGENETTFAVTMALNANQLGIAGAYAVGAGLVHTDAALLRYFRSLWVISLLLALGARVHFRERPPRPPSYSALESLRREAQVSERKNVLAYFKSSKAAIEDAISSSSEKQGRKKTRKDQKKKLLPRTNSDHHDYSAIVETKQGIVETMASAPADLAVSSKRQKKYDRIHALPAINIPMEDDDDYDNISGDEESRDALSPLPPTGLFCGSPRCVRVEDDDSDDSHHNPFRRHSEPDGRAVSVDNGEKTTTPAFHRPKPKRRNSRGVRLLRRWLVISRRVGRGALDVTRDLYSSTASLMQLPAFVECLVAFMASIVASNIFSTFLPHLIATAKVRSKERNATTNARVATLGAFFQFFIMFGSLAFGAVVDYTKAYKKTMLVAFAGSIVALLVIADDRVYSYDLDAAVLLLGAFVGPIQPLAAELAVETSFPDGDENHIVAIQQTFGNWASALAVPVFHTISVFAYKNNIHQEYSLRLDYAILGLVTLFSGLFFRFAPTKGYHAPLRRYAANTAGLTASTSLPSFNAHGELECSGDDLDDSISSYSHSQRSRKYSTV